MCLSSGPNAREQAGAQTSHPCDTVGLNTAFDRRLIMGKGLLHMRTSFLAHRGCCTLAILCELCKSGQFAARLVEGEAQVFDGGRPRQQVLPNIPCARSCACYAEGFGVLRTSKTAAQHHQPTSGRIPIFLSLAETQHALRLRMRDCHWAWVP